MTPKEFLLREGTKALRAAHALEKATAHYVARAELAATLMDLPEPELHRATFLRSTLFVGSA